MYRHRHRHRLFCKTSTSTSVPMFQIADINVLWISTKSSLNTISFHYFTINFLLSVLDKLQNLLFGCFFALNVFRLSWESNIEYICVRATLFIIWIKHLVLFLKHRHRHRTSIVLVNTDIDIASTQKSQHRTCLLMLDG